MPHITPSSIHHMMKQGCCSLLQGEGVFLICGVKSSRGGGYWLARYICLGFLLNLVLDYLPYKNAVKDKLFRATTRIPYVIYDLGGTKFFMLLWKTRNLSGVRIYCFQFNRYHSTFWLENRCRIGKIGSQMLFSFYS